jgi:signal transduction histidine kinase
MSRSALIASNEALKDSERRYRSIFEQSRVALWERDYSQVRAFLMTLKADGVSDLREHVKTHPEIIAACIALIRTVAANKAARELLGTIGDDSATGSMRPYLAPNDATFFDLMEAIFNDERSFEGKGQLIAADGQPKLVLMSMSLPDDPSRFDRVVVGVVDITEREMTQKALLEAQAELTRASRAATVGALSASLAHELNQPLGALVVNAQTMLRWINRDPPDLAAIGRSAERMIRDSQRASDIIHNTRSMLSHELRAPDCVDLPELIRETLALMEHDLGREGISVDISYREGTKTVSAVRIELQQVLINLITNAIQAMTEPNATGRKLLIETDRRDDGFVRVSVRDFGPGLSDEVMAHLFAPFFTTKLSGMGMGLSICRSTMEARGGELLARNHADGGAVFEMIIATGGG